MATLVLGTVGRIFGGPLGGIVGTVLGGVVDRGLFGGGGKAREVGRMGNLAVQSSSYGEPIPFIAGRMRAAGNLIWSSGIKETATRSGGGKRSGTATTSYGYSASFAVGLAAREIAGISRIWADGKVIRDADGVFSSPVTMRLHTGSETQPVDALIAAAEGAGGAPAYRGLAYVVFEDLPLADYGNRIPNLTFEIIADQDEHLDVGQVMAALGTVDRRSLVVLEGRFPTMAGHFSGRSGSIADAIAPLLEISGAAFAGGAGLTVKGGGGEPDVLTEDVCEARAPGDSRNRERRKRAGMESLAGAVEVAFYDVSRDYQPGLQRVRRDAANGVDHQSVACAMSPMQAKSLAAGILARRHAGRLRATVRLPWRFVALQPGALVRFADDDIVWRVRETRFEGFVVHLDLERIEGAQPLAASGDGGRALRFDDDPVGPTLLHLLDLPPLQGEVSDMPRMWIAASGASPTWRRAGVELSGDGGESYATIGVAEGNTAQGVAISVLGPGSVDGWDRFASLDVEMSGEAMWLEGRTPVSVLSGANLALVGDEIIQFAQADALGAQRFRLSQLLRGRRGTEASATAHTVGERFILLDVSTMLPFDPPTEALGRAFRVRAVGPGDTGSVPVIGAATGRALMPLAPAHLRLRHVDGAVWANWTRRSRVGFGWADFVDAPLGEAFEAYRVEIRLDGRLARTETVSVPGFVYGAATRIADGGGEVVTIAVAQLSAAVGPGAWSSRALVL
nr:phage tail protein [Polymorphobacter sp.]